MQLGIGNPWPHLSSVGASKSDITAKPSVMCLDRLTWLHQHEAPVVSYSTALVFLTDTREKCKSTSPNATQVKNKAKDNLF